MNGFESINLLAFIQLLVTADFALFILDESHFVNKIYDALKDELRSRAQKILTTAKSYNERALKRYVKAERTTNAKIRQKTYLINNLINGKPDYDGWSMTGLYGGIYGLVCLITLGVSHCSLDHQVKDFILIYAQITLIIQLLILSRVIVDGRLHYKRNILRIVTLSPLLILITAGIVWFDMQKAYFDTFETPFLIFTLLILFLPFVVGIFHVIIVHIRLWHFMCDCNSLLKKKY